MLQNKNNMSLNCQKALVFGFTSKKGIEELLRQVNLIKGDRIINSFLDIGSGDGQAVNYVKELSNIKRCVGIEIQKHWHETAIKKYPHLELYCDDIVNRPEFIKEFDLIYMNNIMFTNELFWWCFDNMKEGTIVINNKQTISLALKRKGYEVKDFIMQANCMPKETSICVK